MDGFDFTATMRDVCDDLIARLPELAHIDMSRVAISFVQARKRVMHGMQASLTPMRFADGRLVEERNGQRFTSQRLYLDGREMLYILSFYLPRFMDQPFFEKIVTILHELWHIGPEFNGDLRRHEGRYYMHSASERDYDRQMSQLAQRWLALRPSPSMIADLTLNFDALYQRYGRVYGRRIAHPQLQPL